MDQCSSSLPAMQAADDDEDEDEKVSASSLSNHGHVTGLAGD
jgi:hypothetical protein